MEFKKSHFSFLHVIQFFESDQGYEEDLLSKYQAMDGNKVYILTSNLLPGREGRSFLSRIMLPCIESDFNRIIIRLPIFLLPSKASILIGAIIPLIFLRYDYLQLHGLLNPLGFLYGIIARLRRKKVISDNHDFIYSTHQLAYKGRSIYHVLRKYEFIIIRKILGKLQLNISNYIFAYERLCVNFLKDFYEFRGNIKMLKIGFDHNLFKVNKKIPNKNKEIINIGFVGQISKRKKPEELLKIVNRLPGNYHLIIIGGWEKNTLRNFQILLENYKLKNRIKIIGEVNYTALPKFMNQLDLCLYLHSSSVSCLQILGCGIPILISQNQQFAESALYYGDILNSFKEGEIINLVVNWINKNLISFPQLSSDSKKYKKIVEDLSFQKTYLEICEYIK